MLFGRLGGSLEKSGSISALPMGQGALDWGFLRGPVLPDHWLRSEAAESGVPLDCKPFVAMVVLEEVDEMEDDEFDRESCLRGANIALNSSGFGGLLLLIVPHAGREI